MPDTKIQLRLLIGGFQFGPGKADLLDLIARHGSISAAGRAMQMSYKRAWSLVEEMNQAFRAPLVTAERGGAGHGGAKVTEAGQNILNAYRRLQAQAETAGSAEIAAITAQLQDKPALPAAPAQDNDMFDQT